MRQAFLMLRQAGGPAGGGAFLEKVAGNWLAAAQKSFDNSGPAEYTEKLYYVKTHGIRRTEKETKTWISSIC